jgi:hypothetical protein
MNSPEDSSGFVGFNSIDEDEDGYRGDGVYIDPKEIAAIEGFFKTDYGKYSVIHLKSGAKFKILGSVEYMLKQAFPKKNEPPSSYEDLIS